MLKLLFLDIDGVLNRGKPMANGYCGIDRDCAEQLNRILAECPTVQLVISSAWRYGVHKGWHTLAGMEHLLLTHGIDCKGRVHGVTGPDAEVHAGVDSVDWQTFTSHYWHSLALNCRPKQIDSYIRGAGVHVDDCVVLDDLPLDNPQLIQTVTEIGLDEATADKVIAVFAKLVAAR